MSGELVGGDRFAGRLEGGIRRSANGVLMVSPHALSRPWVREEYEALLRQAVEQPGRRLIPVLYADAARLAQKARHGPRAWAFWHRTLPRLGSFRTRRAQPAPSERECPLGQPFLATSPARKLEVPVPATAG